jgi:hypothetical protein
VLLLFEQDMAWHGMAFLPTFPLLLPAGVAGSRNSPWAESDGGLHGILLGGVLDLRSGCDFLLEAFFNIYLLS